MPLALLVDRDADARQMYAEFLRQSTWDTDETEDGREALAKAITRHPDIVVTETRLLGISGYDLCRLLRDDTATRDIPIIVVATADAFVGDTFTAVAAGADVVVVKPCLPESLAKTIQELLMRDRQLHERGQAVEREAGLQVARPQRAVDPVARAPATRRAHNRRDDTTKAPLAPPVVVCPQCDRPLHYRESYIGGVRASQEQWDYFECAAGCGGFQYRQRTRKLRRVA